VLQLLALAFLVSSDDDTVVFFVGLDGAVGA